ncbi:MAG: selenium cofactor biosynthesis protein YqeC [Bacillota bacterium]
MKFKDYLEVRKNDMITFVGAGGKTTSIKRLAAEYKNNLIITTTTHFFPFNSFEHEEIIIKNMEKMDLYLEEIKLKAADNIVVVGREKDSCGKIQGISPIWLDRLKDRLPESNFLVEGDGAKGKYIKVPAEHEPVIPERTDIIAVVLGMNNFGEKISKKNSFRINKLTEIADGEYIDEKLIVKILTSKKSYGYYKDKCRNYISILTQINEENYCSAKKIADVLISQGIYKVLLINYNYEEYVVETIK